MITGRLIAHRGWRNRYPENTLQGINAAIEIGAQHVEIDVQLTSDGIPILCHDNFLQRVCGSNQNITHSSFTQICKLSAHEPQRLGERFFPTPLPTLKDCAALLNKHSEVTLYVELKAESIDLFGADAVLDAVLPCLQLIAEHCFLISFNLDILRQAKQRGWKLTAAVLTSFQQTLTTEIQKLSPDFIFCDKDLLDSENTLQQLPYPAAFYEIGNYQQAALLLAEGASLIETFSIGELIAADKNNLNENMGEGSE